MKHPHPHPPLHPRTATVVAVSRHEQPTVDMAAPTLRVTSEGLVLDKHHGGLAFAWDAEALTARARLIIKQWFVS